MLRVLLGMPYLVQRPCRWVHNPAQTHAPQTGCGDLLPSIVNLDNIVLFMGIPKQRKKLFSSPTCDHSCHDRYTLRSLLYLKIRFRRCDRQFGIELMQNSLKWFRLANAVKIFIRHILLKHSGRTIFCPIFNPLHGLL